MSERLSIEEKVYQKILSLQANDQFMADVLALREKANQSEVFEEDGKSYLMKRLLWNLEIQSKEMASSSFKMPYELLKKSPKNGDFLQMLGRKGSNLRMGASKAPALPLGYSPRVRI